jgi:hypothetical protein
VVVSELRELTIESPPGWDAFGSPEGWQELTASELVLIHDDRGQRGTRWRIMRVVEEHPQRVEVAQLKEPGHLRHYTLADFVRSFGVVPRPSTLLARFAQYPLAEQLGSGGALLPACAELEAIPPRDIFDMLLTDANCAECEAELHRGDIVWMRPQPEHSPFRGLLPYDMVCIPCARGPLLEGLADPEQRVSGEFREVALAEGEAHGDWCDCVECKKRRFEDEMAIVAEVKP